MAKSSIVKGVIKKAINPTHAYAALKRHRGKGDLVKSAEDPQLKFIAKICPGDFLNYGHFEDVSLEGVDLSVKDILRAQTLNAELLVGLVRDEDKSILDVGCGMGGVLRLLRERGLDPVGLTPNRYQTGILKEKFAGIELLESKFEDMPVEANAGRFDVLLMSESLQFMNLDRVFPVVEKILKPDGRWLVVDFFRTDQIGERSGQLWGSFEHGLDANGWNIVETFDHTANVLPLLRYVHMIGANVFRPLFQFAFDKLQQKQPGFHYLLEEAIERFNSKGEKMLDVMNPESFATHKKYLLMAIERK